MVQRIPEKTIENRFNSERSVNRLHYAEGGYSKGVRQRVIVSVRQRESVSVCQMSHYFSVSSELRWVIEYIPPPNKTVQITKF